MSTPNNTVSLADILKEKERYTLLTVSESIMAAATRQQLVVKHLRFPHNGTAVTACSFDKKRKMFGLEGVLSRGTGAMLFKGWEDEGILTDMDSMRFKPPGGYTNGIGITGFIADGCLNLWHNEKPANEETAHEIIEIMKRRLVFNNLSPRIRWKLYSPDRETSYDMANFPMYLPRHILAPLPGAEAARPVLTKDPLTAGDRKKLLAVEAKRQAATEEWEYDKPLVKLFKTGSAATWLVYSMEEDGDTMWAVCDLGMGCVEFGTVSLEEIRTPIPRTGPVEKDKWFDGKQVLPMQELLSKESLSGDIYVKTKGMAS